jgi:hypothetical protein
MDATGIKWKVAEDVVKAGAVPAEEFTWYAFSTTVGNVKPRNRFNHSSDMNSLGSLRMETERKNEEREYLQGTGCI